VLDAQRTLLLAQDALAQSERDVALDVVALYKAVGGGWDTGGTPQQTAARSSGSPG
jgi:multidrug efflux system outer membrane protein